MTYNTSLLGPAIAMIPPIAHFLEKTLDRFRVVNRKTLYERLSADMRPKVREALSNKEVFKAVNTYFDFEEDAHFIVSLCIFNIVSLFVTHIEIETSYISVVIVIAALASVVFGLVFAFRVASYKFPMDAIDPTQKWRGLAYGISIATVVLEIALVVHEKF